MPRIAFLIILLLTSAAPKIYALDYGLRLKSHSFPAKERTSVAVGNTPYRLEKDFKLGFFFSFYDSPMFGNIATLRTDDGQRISVVASTMDDGTYRLALVVNDNMHRIKTPLSFDINREDHVDVTLDKKNNVAKLMLNSTEIELPIDLSKSKSVNAYFGLDNEAKQPDVAPVELRTTRIFINGQNTNHWDFKYHNSDSTALDDLNGVMLSVKNPHWLIDDHTDWTPIYSTKIKDNIQTAFNPDDEVFYIIDDKEMVTFNPISRDSVVSKIAGGNRIMTFSNHLAYNPLLNKIVNYNLSHKTTTSLDLNTMIWNGTQGDGSEEANFSNHAVAIAGDTLYAFGGYGFYRYHSNLFTVNLSTGVVDEHKLSPEMIPMTSAAAAVVGDKLYLFGGKGNDSGRQELPSSYTYALYEYDINTWKGKEIWKIDSMEHDFLPSQTMFYDEDDDCFYFAATCFGGQLLRISRTKPEISIASSQIHSKMDFYDFVFDLYRSKDGKRYYLVIDKRLDPQTHDLTIYTISAPFLSDENEIFHKMPTSAQNIKSSENKHSIWGWLIPVIIVIAGAGAAFLFWRRRKSNISAASPDTIVGKTNEENITVNQDNSLVVPSLPPYNYNKDEKEDKEEAEDFNFVNLTESNEPKYFNRDKSSISFLGGFAVRDKEGNDITAKFTARLKHLLIMLLLSSMKHDSGIKYQIIDEEIWSDKDEKSAQNNRNVSMRKLRLLLEEVGDMVISYDKGFFRIDTKDVFFDYKELKSRIDEIQNSENVKPELVDQILELLLMGPMLPNTTYDWLDSYKSDFSNSALEILTKLLKYELGRDDKLAYKIAETISLHDTLNEDALLAKCQVLSRRKMLGLAKNVYSKFVKDYKKSMGEDYTLSFADVCKANISAE